MFAFKRRIVTVSGHFFIFKTKMSAFKRHSYHHEICQNESLVKADFLTLIIMYLDIIVSI
jgi:hypothetical protein